MERRRDRKVTIFSQNLNAVDNFECEHYNDTRIQRDDWDKGYEMTKDLMIYHKWQFSDVL